jgi:hypothetical protein
MRDDIHKSAPLPRAWRAVVKRCQREADWQSASLLVRRAQAAEFKAAVSPAFLDALRDDCSTKQPAIFPSENLANAGAAARGAFERRVLLHAKLLISAGVSGGAVVDEALRRGVQEASAARLRQLDVHLAKNFRRDRDVMMRRMSSAISESDIVDFARRAAVGAPLTERANKPSLDLDDDLRGGKR